MIHLDRAGRDAAYAGFARVPRPGGHALLAFHTSDADLRPGQARHLTTWWDHPVDLAFHFLDPGAETAALARAGITLAARPDRVPDPAVEHVGRRTYLLLRRPGVTGPPDTGVTRR
ncbi:hypothetical protein AB0H29_18775 [Streptomyces thermolilacinus]